MWPTTYGKIKKYEIQPISIQNDETAAQNRLTISIEINYINNLDNSKNFQTTFSDYIDFNSDLIFSNIELKGSCGGEKEDCHCSFKEMVKCKLKANP